MKTKRKPIPKKLRQEVYNKYNGHCAYCGCELEIKDMQVDHIDSFLLNGENLDIKNLNPACRTCNFYKSTYNIDRFRGELEEVRNRLKKVFIYKLAVKHGIVTENNNPIKFYFEEVHIEHN